MEAVLAKKAGGGVCYIKLCSSRVVRSRHVCLFANLVFRGDVILMRDVDIISIEQLFSMCFDDTYVFLLYIPSR